MADGQWLGNMKDKIAGIVGNQDPIRRGRTGENGDIGETRENRDGEVESSSGAAWGSCSRLAAVTT
ncbi:hypothetical protein E4U32_000422 [Claviceps aff. humidiphila group G2b]|nr:hypothetical protein E4U32_000422 [Claviceps aff. humidiphila group G2b]